MSRASERSVLIIVQDLPVPYDRRSWSIARTLRDFGHPVTVICPKDSRHRRWFEDLDGVHVRRYPMPLEARGAPGYVFEFAWCWLWALALSVWVRLTGRGFRVIHACNPPETYWLLALLWRPFGVRFVFDHHDLSPEMYRAKYGRDRGVLLRGLSWLERRTFATANTVLATNESYKEIACGRGRRRPADVFVVRSGPDRERIVEAEPEPELRRGRAYLCVYLGKMCEQDGVDYLMRAIRILVADRGRLDIQFTLIGEGPEQPALKRLAGELGIAESCWFPGFLPDRDVARHLATADLGIDPDPKTEWSDRSTMNKILDYMVFGCPIVCFDLTEHRVSADEGAVYVEPNSEERMADAIEELLGDPERRARMAAGSRRRVRSGLLWEHSKPALAAAYDHVFEGAVSPLEKRHQGGRA